MQVCSEKMLILLQLEINVGAFVHEERDKKIKSNDKNKYFGI